VSALALALVWIGAGVLAAALLPRLRLRRAAGLAPLAAGLSALAATRSEAWPGPLASVGYGGHLELGRIGLGLIVAGGVALSVSLSLAPYLDGGEVLPACLVGAAVVVALSATVPLIWGLAFAVAVGALAVRWIGAAPGRGSLAAGRVAGLGAAALIGAATFLPSAGPGVATRTALAGGLLAGGISTLLGLLPVGGWAAGAVASIRGGDLAAWGLLLAPAVLLSAGTAIPDLPAGAHTPTANVLLCLGLASALFGSAMAAVAPPQERYGRVLLADLALAAAGLGSTHSAGRLGGLLIVLTHLAAAPLLLHPPRPGLARPRQLSWLALTGVPPTPSFWGRLLILEALAATSGSALAAGICAAGGLLAGALAGLTSAASAASAVDDAGQPAVATRLLAWLVPLCALGIGLAPAGIAGRIFGVDFAAGF